MAGSLPLSGAGTAAGWPVQAAPADGFSKLPAAFTSMQARVHSLPQMMQSASNDVVVATLLQKGCFTLARWAARREAEARSLSEPTLLLGHHRTPAEHFSPLKSREQVSVSCEVPGAAVKMRELAEQVAALQKQVQELQGALPPKTPDAATAKCTEAVKDTSKLVTKKSETAGSAHSGPRRRSKRSTTMAKQASLLVTTNKEAEKPPLPVRKSARIARREVVASSVPSAAPGGQRKRARGWSSEGATNACDKPATVPCIIQPLPTADSVLGAQDPFSDEDEDVVRGMHKPLPSPEDDEDDDELFSQVLSPVWHKPQQALVVGGGTGTANVRVQASVQPIQLYADLGDSDSDGLISMTQGQ